MGQHALLQGRARRRSASTPALSESPITPVIVGEAALAMKMSDRLFAEGVFAQGIGFPTVAQGRGPAAHHRLGHPHPRRPAVRPRHHGQGRPGTRRSLEARQYPHMPPLVAGARLLRRLHAGPDQRRAEPALHARHARGRTGSSPAASTRRPFKALPWHRRAARVHAGLLHGLHDAPHAGAAGDLRRGAGGGGHRRPLALPRLQRVRRADHHPAVLLPRRPADAGLRPGHPVARSSPSR